MIKDVLQVGEDGGGSNDEAFYLLGKDDTPMSCY